MKVTGPLGEHIAGAGERAEPQLQDWRRQRREKREEERAVVVTF